MSNTRRKDKTGSQLSKCYKKLQVFWNQKQTKTFWLWKTLNCSSGWKQNVIDYKNRMEAGSWFLCLSFQFFTKRDRFTFESRWEQCFQYRQYLKHMHINAITLLKLLSHFEKYLPFYNKREMTHKLLKVHSGSILN